MSVNVKDWLIKVYNLEDDLKILLNLEDPISESIADKSHSICSITTKSLNLKLYEIFKDFIEIDKKFSDVVVQTSEDVDVSGSDLVAKLASNSFLRLFLRLVIQENCNSATASVALENLANGVDGNLVDELNTINKLLDKDG